MAGTDSVLHLGLRSLSIRSIKFLLNIPGINYKALGANNQTPLHALLGAEMLSYSFKFQKITKANLEELVRIVRTLAAECDIEAKDSKGETCLDILKTSLELDAVKNNQDLYNKRITIYNTLKEALEIDKAAE